MFSSFSHHHWYQVEPFPPPPEAAAISNDLDFLKLIFGIHRLLSNSSPIPGCCEKANADRCDPGRARLLSRDFREKSCAKNKNKQF